MVDGDKPDDKQVCWICLQIKWFENEQNLLKALTRWLRFFSHLIYC